MTLFSKLRMKLARWLLPHDAVLSSPSTLSTNPLTPDNWETLRGLLSLVSSMAPSSTRDSAAIHQLEVELLQQQKEVAKQEWQTEHARTVIAQRSTMPHQTYLPHLHHDGIQWVAEVEFAEGEAIVGRGNCPNAALIDFDNQWLGLK